MEGGVGRGGGGGGGVFHLKMGDKQPLQTTKINTIFALVLFHKWHLFLHFLSTIKILADA